MLQQALTESFIMHSAAKLQALNPTSTYLLQPCCRVPRHSFKHAALQVVFQHFSVEFQATSGFLLSDSASFEQCSLGCSLAMRQSTK